MTLTKKLFDEKLPYLFFIKFLLCFSILYSLFYIFMSLTNEGGKLYSSFFETHLNVIKGLTSVLITPAKYLLQAFHFTVYQKNYHTLRIAYSTGISVNPACLGWGVMSFWVAFVYGNSNGLVEKLKWITIGLSSIIVLNITRIVLIAIANHLHWKTITSLDHHQTFNVFSYGCIFLLMYFYIANKNKYVPKYSDDKKLLFA